jgi:hypothetical protein
MSPGASDREKELLAETLAKLSDDQKAYYEKQVMLFEDRGARATDAYRLAVAGAIAKGMPARYTGQELADIARREERRQQDDAIRQGALHAGGREAQSQEQSPERERHRSAEASRQSEFRAAAEEVSEPRAARLERLRRIQDDIDRERRDNEGKGIDRGRDPGGRSR